jgi:hypothetical protein
MRALRAYLFLRGKLLYRLLHEIGALRLALLLPIVVAALGRGLVLAARHPVGQ